MWYFTDAPKCSCTLVCHYINQIQVNHMNNHLMFPFLQCFMNAFGIDEEEKVTQKWKDFVANCLEVSRGCNWCGSNGMMRHRGLKNPSGVSPPCLMKSRLPITRMERSDARHAYATFAHVHHLHMGTAPLNLQPWMLTGRWPLHMQKTEGWCAGFCTRWLKP